MPPVIVQPDLDVSYYQNESGQVDIDFLMPNGMLVPMKCDIDRPLDQIKQDLWKKAACFPLFQELTTYEKYGFMFINSEGQKEDVLDETVGIGDIRLAATFLKVIDKPPDDNHRTLDRQINSLIGMKGSNYIQAQHSLSKQEIQEFRTKMLSYCETEILGPVYQDSSGWLNFQYKHPIRLRIHDELPPDVNNMVIKHLVLSVFIEEANVSYKLQVKPTDHPRDLIQVVLQKWSNKSGRTPKNPDDYILQVVGLNDFLYGEHKLVSFKYVYNCIVKYKAPEFWLKHKDKVLVHNEIPKPKGRPSFGHGSFEENRRMTRHEKKGGTCVWDIHQNFYITLHSVCNINLPDNFRFVKLCVGIFHGPDPLCSIVETKEIPVPQDGLCGFNGNINFEIKVQDLPQMSRLCFGLHTKKGRDGILAWANIPIFDYKSNLQRGKIKLPMWPRTENQILQQNESSCYPIGTVATNPQGDCSIVEFTVPDFNVKKNIYFPQLEKILQCANDNMEEPGQPGSPTWRPNKMHIQELNNLLYSNQYKAIEELDLEQTKQLVWWMRYEIRENVCQVPHALQFILNSLKWDNHIEVCKMQAILQIWPELKADQALAMLDFTFPDKYIRKKACDSLERMPDDEFCQYLLQLVQALKFENYLNCDLVKLLLTRALTNQHIGHKLFWLLKSELHDPSQTVQYGLIIEVYLKCNPEHMYVLEKQQTIIQKLKSITEIQKKAANDKNMKKYKSNKDDSPLKKVMKTQSYIEAFCKIYNPISLLYRLDKILEDSCRIMDSKKKPFWLEWTNEDEKGQNIDLIFKCGDDLRQDMLTLQLLEVMDNLWQAADLDLRLSPYGCIATGHEEGIIEVVQKATTLARIQARKGVNDKASLYEWLKEKNPSEHGLKRAVEEFTLSCAGYAVATYILGVGDRHNDNIMLKETGQLFHIDFGHFLGNKKSKFYINREPVPFILTDHFVYIITNGDKDPQNFIDFKNLCEKAYLIIRDNASLVIQLFTMMISSGIPQLTSVNDLQYLKDVLELNYKRNEASERFRTKFNEAKENSYKTTINWWFHMKAHKM